ncbi:MAG: radical SAM protein [Candidatus Hydrogenedentota bacterium]
MNNKSVLLIYPPLGSDDIFIRDIPLSLLYAATLSVKNGYHIEILDLRICKDFRGTLIKRIAKGDILLVGISVLTGNPIKYAIEITDIIKSFRREIKIVWGGHHSTMEPESTMGFKKIDFLIRGFGSKPLKKLIEQLFNDTNNFSEIQGLTYRDGDKIISNDIETEWEIINYKDIPYHLIENNLVNYSRFKGRDRTFPIFTSMGCPYKCSFCMAPLLYKNFKRKIIYFDIDEVIEHIKFLIERYNATEISIYDDDSFVDIKRMEYFFKRIIGEDIRIKIDFRGIRIDELYRLDNNFLELMRKAGVRHFQVGLESGSQKVLDILNKNIKIEQIIEVNRRLIDYKELVPLYNLMTGIPGETIAELKATRDLVLKLYNENPNCIIGFPAKFKPLPGTELYKIAVKDYNLRKIDTLSEWAKIDTAETDLYFPWYTRECNNYIKMFQVVSFFIDKKILREIECTSVINKILRIIAILYRPVALFRLKHNITLLNIEYFLYTLIRRAIQKIRYL